MPHLALRVRSGHNGLTEYASSNLTPLHPDDHHHAVGLTRIGH
jgi:hypothetical protein